MSDEKQIAKVNEIEKYERELIKSQSKQLDNPQFMTISVKHAGVQRFELPATGDEGDEDRLRKTFSGVIIFNHRMNSYWSKPFGESDSVIPDCFSLDAIHGTKYGECADCKYNQWGSASEGKKGKACRNMWRLYVYLNKGMILPYQISIPPTSIKNFQNYIISLMSRGMAVERMVTAFSIIPGAQESSVVRFAEKKKLDDDAFLFYLSKRNKFMHFMKSAVFFEEAEEKAEPEEDNVDFMPDDEDAIDEELGDDEIGFD